MKPCAKCGAIDRISDGSCRPCARARESAWRKANPEKVKASKEKWKKANQDKVKSSRSARYIANRARVKELADKWRANNVEKSREYCKRWAANNPDSRRIRDHNRRARERNAGGKLSNGLAEKLYKLQKGKCACCGEHLGDDYHLDHIMPIALGGTNTDDNIQLLKSSCNQQKYSKHPVDFMQSKGFLL